MGQITIVNAGAQEHDRLASEIGSNLLRSLAAQNEQSINGTICISAKAPDGSLIGGVSGSTSYGWLLVKLLWVDEHYRQVGIGRRLVHNAEEQAKSVGCHSAWLDTSSHEARTFYARLGYDVFGTLSNALNRAPVGHHRWFMKKAL
ncbi:MAG: GNAT family N-acetyltransferase [Pseudomonadota bacterium]